MSDDHDEESADEANEPEADDVDAQDTEEENVEEDENVEETDEESLQEGDFVTVDYTARTVEDDQLVDTTDPGVADDEGVNADQEFEPRTIVLGEGHLFPGVEEKIVGSTVGASGTAVVPAGEAFGEYDDDEVRTISTDRIPEDDRYPGAQVQVDGDQGFVETIVGGRARVDFNHPLAGADIEYEYEVLDTVDDRTEQAEQLLRLFLDLDLQLRFETDTVEEEQLVEPDEDEADEGEDEEADPELETVEVEKESLYIEATPQLTMNQQWMMQKQQIGQQMMELLGIDRIVVEEIIDGGGMGMGMPGMMGGTGGAGGLEEALEEADVDADELAEEL
ncbi:peptidylprolyl isomerase [Halobacteriales archaeon QH_10_67_13]|nr:MAG: peptidylprolyl isomerase [Halobacteriales archaeon QH_10_67_13]